MESSDSSIIAQDLEKCNRKVSADPNECSPRTDCTKAVVAENYFLRLLDKRIAIRYNKSKETTEVVKSRHRLDRNDRLRGEIGSF